MSEYPSFENPLAEISEKLIKARCRFFEWMESQCCCPVSITHITCGSMIKSIKITIHTDGGAFVTEVLDEYWDMNTLNRIISLIAFYGEQIRKVDPT